MIIKAYVGHLFRHEEITDPTRAVENPVHLMGLKIARRDPTEGLIEIDKEQLAPEVLFVDLVNTLGKLTANINTVLHYVRSRLTTLDPIALQTACRPVRRHVDPQTYS